MLGRWKFSYRKNKWLRLASRKLGGLTLGKSDCKNVGWLTSEAYLPSQVDKRDCKSWNVRAGLAVGQAGNVLWTFFIHVEVFSFPEHYLLRFIKIRHEIVVKIKIPIVPHIIKVSHIPTLWNPGANILNKCSAENISSVVKVINDNRCTPITFRFRTDLFYAYIFVLSLSPQ